MVNMFLYTTPLIYETNLFLKKKIYMHPIYNYGKYMFLYNPCMKQFYYVINNYKGNGSLWYFCTEQIREDLARFCQFTNLPIWVSLRITLKNNNFLNSNKTLLESSLNCSSHAMFVLVLESWPCLSRFCNLYNLVYRTHFRIDFCSNIKKEIHIFRLWISLAPMETA